MKTTLHLVNQSIEEMVAQPIAQFTGLDRLDETMPGSFPTYRELADHLASIGADARIVAEIRRIDEDWVARSEASQRQRSIDRQLDSAARVKVDMLCILARLDVSSRNQSPAVEPIADDPRLVPMRKNFGPVVGGRFA